MTTWNLQKTRCHLLICNGGSCIKRGGEEVIQEIRREIKKLNADNIIHTTRTRCNGRCADACVVIAYPDGIWYRDITPETGRQLVRRHVVGQHLEEQVVYTYEHQFIASERAVEGITKG
ncbi:(2Fe-2S) ferredoxin domain-containing protein [Paenibacillus mendelii]|uniref:Ferredoxin n=1 Tax=Paenibacillus mendelii TaxID=206163 RepID=A0ABV6J664_9BACL|nr:(2Fe-2S) ferredoxin domain-containing protein [Paenibacillus mendelii]MCQ6559920.1 (2Fe-2S) ferredoxin domain-containing protein [Paenibacillus mendelii]